MFQLAMVTGFAVRVLSKSDDTPCQLAEYGMKKVNTLAPYLRT
jgi:hypothetical protein